MINDTNYRISWIQNDTAKRTHAADWYWAVWIITISLSVAFFILGNMLLSIIILLGMGILLSSLKNPHEEIIYGLSTKGVHVQKTIYPWDELESFFIPEEDPDQKEKNFPKLLLTSKRSILPYVTVPLNTATVQEVRQLMTTMLPEVPRNEPIIDRIMHITGL